MDDHFRINCDSDRPQSPNIEYAVQRSLRTIFAELLSSKGLYQNLRIDVAMFAPFADENTTADDLISEFTSRPVCPVSKGEGDDQLLALRAGRSGGRSIGNHGVGENRDIMPMGFYLPNISSYCPICAKATPFLSRSDSYGSFHGSFVPPVINRGDALHQLYNLFYSCSDCANFVLAFQLVRDGLRYQLTGRSIPFRPPIDDEWPKEIRPIVQDAVVAMAEGDVPAAYYHLRTALEHHLKLILNIDLRRRIDGCDLCEQYNAQIDAALKSRFASVSEVYSKLSEGMHARITCPEEFQDLFGKLLDHLKAKLLFDKYQPVNQPTNHG